MWVMWVSDGVEILLGYGGVFREQVVDGEASPLVDVRVRVGEVWLMGSESSVASDWVAEWFRVALGAFAAVCGGSSSYVTFLGGPAWLVFSTVADPQPVRLAFCHLFESAEDPSVRRAFEPSVVVSKTAWVSELVRAGREFVFRVVEANPELVDDPYLVRLREVIREIEAEYPECVDDGE